MSQEEVRALTGDPDETSEINLGGGEEPPQVNWTWKLEDGVVIFEFETASDSLAAYRTTSPSFSTSDGISVGDPVAPLRVRLGDRLKPGIFGGYIVSDTEPVPVEEPAISLQTEGEDVTAIRGGSLVQPAGE